MTSGRPLPRHRTAAVGAVAVALMSGACTPTSDPLNETASSTAPTPAASPSPSPSPTVAPNTGGAMVVWGRGDLTSTFAEAVAALPDVAAAAHVRGGTLGLTETVAGDGSVRERHVDGFRVPVSLSAIDPGSFAAVLGPDEDPTVLRQLEPGAVLLSETGARLRGVGVGATVTIAGVTLEVAGTLADGLVGRAEVVAHVADAEALGLDGDGTVYLRHGATAGTATATLTRAIEDLVPADVTARVVDARDRDARRRAPLVLSLSQVKDAFGEFAFRPAPDGRDIVLDPGFTETHIVSADVPLLGSVRCHRDIIEDLRDALDVVVAAGLSDEVDSSRYAGCFTPRRISTDGDSLSHHAWGIALDINVDVSLPGGGEPPHPDVIAAFTANGFRWGGDFLVPDNHHFEWVRRTG